MTNEPKRVLILLFLLILSSIFFGPLAFSQQPQVLNEGIGLYKAEKYDEAVNVLIKARQEDPKSSAAAFFLGMTYKQLMDYETARGQLEDAVTLTPKIREALIELIDVCVRLGKTDEAKQWIAVAEQENIQPANTAFLKGLVLTQEGKNKEAAACFEKAKSIDPKIAQASDIQIALSRLKESDMQSAKESFQAAITADPQTDLAGFARRYLARVEETMEARKPFRFTLSLFGQYDDNMVLKPTDDSLAVGVTNEGSLVGNTAFRVSYAPEIKGPWLFTASDVLSSSLHQHHGDTHDSLINTISITPGYNFGKYALNLAATYSYAFVRNPGYDKYSANLSVGPMLRMAVKNNQLLEVFAGYADNSYFQPVFMASEDRDSKGLSAYASWVWLFRKNSFLNIRYQFMDQNAVGDNWDNKSHSISANTVIPASETVKLQFSGEYTMKGFTNTHTIFDVKRDDDIYALSAGATWAFYKKMSLIGQYTRVGNSSNIGIYDYTRNLYTLGLEYRF